jgi:Zn-dependent M28 family amino/carboxypeptidase
VQAARKDGSLRSLKALVLLDMIGDRDLVVRRDSNSTPWLVDIIWRAAARLGHGGTFSNELTTIEDDHVPFLKAGVPAVDLIDLETPMRRGSWHTPNDTLEFVSAKSLQTVGDVVSAAIPEIEKRIGVP